MGMDVTKDGLQNLPSAVMRGSMVGEDRKAGSHYQLKAGSVH